MNEEKRKDILRSAHPRLVTSEGGHRNSGGEEKIIAVGQTPAHTVVLQSYFIVGTPWFLDQYIQVTW